MHLDALLAECYEEEQLMKTSFTFVNINLFFFNSLNK